MPKYAWINGAVLPFADATVPLEDRGLQFGESLYEVVAITAGRVRDLDAHEQRMKRAARNVGIQPPDDWSVFARELLVREKLSEGLLYVQVTGGTAPRSHLPAMQPPSSAFAYLIDYRFPRAADVARGVRVLTQPDTRWAHCHWKTTMLLPAVMARRVAADSGAAEALFVGADEAVHEGAATNVFLVEGAGLVTPQQSPDILPGLTRQMLEPIARDAGLPTSGEVVTLNRLRQADEVFITSTTELVMPVTHVDDVAIGEGTPGPRSIDLAARLRAHLELE